MFRVNNKDARTTPLAGKYQLGCYLRFKVRPIALLPTIFPDVCQNNSRNDTLFIEGVFRAQLNI